MDCWADCTTLFIVYQMTLKPNSTEKQMNVEQQMFLQIVSQTKNKILYSILRLSILHPLNPTWHIKHNLFWQLSIVESFFFFYLRVMQCILLYVIPINMTFYFYFSRKCIYFVRFVIITWWNNNTVLFINFVGRVPSGKIRQRSVSFRIAHEN